jgi:cytochrome P450
LKSGSTDDIGVAAEDRLDDPMFHLGDPHATYRRLRREAPVYWCASGQFWALTKHADIVWAESQGSPPLTCMQGLFMAEAKQQERIADRDPTGLQQSGATFMSDPPNLTRFRRLVGGAFTEQRLVGMEERVRSIAVELLDALPENQAVDFVEAVSIPLAFGVAGEFLGVPREDWDRLRQWTDAHRRIIGGGDAEGSPELQRAVAGEREMHEYFADALAQRRRNPRGDLMSTIASMHSDSEALSEEAQAIVCVAFLVAGTDATRNVLAGAMECFAQFPDQWERILGDRSLVRNATEELLRWVTPVLHFGRRATQPFVIRDVEVAEGEFVVMLYESGNRDEDVWDDPDRFDVTRSIEHRNHLSFGWGLHRCIGSALGRAEIDTVLDEMAKRYRGWELAGPVVRTPSTIVKDYQRVPIALASR